MRHSPLKFFSCLCILFALVLTPLPGNVAAAISFANGGMASHIVTLSPDAFPSIHIDAPTISRVSPAYGNRGSTLILNVTGTNFVPGSTSLYFDGPGISVNSVTVSSSVELKASITISPLAPYGSRDVTVTTSNGSATWVGGLSIVNSQPAVSSIYPSSTTTGESLDVEITGSNFIAGVMSVNLGSGIEVDSVTVVSPTRLRVRVSVASSASTGPRSISVMNASPGGGSATMQSGLRILNAKPTIASISPAAGGRGTTVDVTVEGSGFIPGGTTISLGNGITLGSMVVVSPTKITARAAIALQLSAGTCDLIVTNPSPGGGTSTLTGGFMIQNPAPVVTGTSPTVGLPGESLELVLTGNGLLRGVTSIELGDGISSGDLKLDTSGMRLTAPIMIALNTPAGARSVKVTNAGPGGGSIVLSGAFIVENPIPHVTGLTPSSGTRGRTFPVTLTGTNFVSGSTSVSFGDGVTVATVVVNSATSLTATISVAEDAVNAGRTVAVTNPGPGGGSASITHAFNVENAAPSVAGITPASAFRGQSIGLTVSGSDFYADATTVSLGPGITISSSTITSRAEMKLNVTVAPDAAMGGRNLVVTNASPGGGSVTVKEAFSVVHAAPTISSVSPSSAGKGSLLPVTITGTQFESGITTLDFGPDVTVEKLSVKNSTTIEASVRLSTLVVPGTRSVTVTNAPPGGGAVSLAGAFTITSGSAAWEDGSLGLVPDDYILQEAYPNPFNPTTRIRYGIPEESRVKLEVHNMLGNVVAYLIEGVRSSGLYELEWRADNLPSGVYLIRMSAESTESSKHFIASRKVVLVK